MKIFFLENTSVIFNSSDRYDNKIRGGESVLINLSENLAKLGHDVCVFNNCYKDKEIINSVTWQKISLLKNNLINNKCDIAITQADANLLKLVKSKNNFLLSHSVQTIEKFIRKKQIISFIKFKPKVIVASDYHWTTRSFITSMYGKIRLFWSVDNIFISEALNSSIPPKKAIFTTRPDRNLKKLIKIWNQKIYPFAKDSFLYVTPPYEIKDEDINIKLRTLGNQKILLNNLKNTRVMLVPGHKGEIFCIAAQEAAEMCIPIVTFGIGALSERVEHNKTGFIAKNDDEFAMYSLKLLNDEKIWNKFRNNLFELRGKKTWLESAKKLEHFLLNE